MTTKTWVAVLSGEHFTSRADILAKIMSLRTRQKLCTVIGIGELQLNRNGFKYLAGDIECVSREGKTYGSKTFNLPPDMETISEFMAKNGSFAIQVYAVKSTNPRGYAYAMENLL